MADKLRQDFGFSNPLEDAYDDQSEAAGVTNLQPFPWTPRSRWAVFEGAVQTTEAGAVISGQVRLPYGPFLIAMVGITVNVAIAVFESPAALIMTSLFAIIYLLGRFASLPQAEQSLRWWLAAFP